MNLLRATHKVFPLSMDDPIHGSIHDLCWADSKTSKGLFHLSVAFVAPSHIISPPPTYGLFTLFVDCPQVTGLAGTCKDPRMEIIHKLHATHLRNWYFSIKANLRISLYHWLFAKFLSLFCLEADMSVNNFEIIFLKAG